LIIQNRIIKIAHDTAHDDSFNFIEDLPQRLLWIIEGEMSKREIMRILDLPHRYNFDQNYFNPTFERKWIEMTLPDKPRSQPQKYRLTKEGIKEKNRLKIKYSTKYIK